MAQPQVNVTMGGGSGMEALRQRLQESVEANRIALNLRQQSQQTTAKALRAASG